ncbi:hypothetical protein [Ruegeria sp. PrR005]|uniref:DUF2147 domain-containing protein n=1 Tax=Ruegeria sp. PrR005 TaxID=2706882 RepID=A0A6B2NX70_9RHOB|nr:hypothetical protein [Ruegeria sp. PrR005]NDW47690.1 hypothetical protein [Ruegeria sp. PrR005]
MKQGLRLCLLAQACALMFAGAAAAGQVYDCQVTPKSRDGWIAPRLIIDLDEALGTAVVADGLIMEVIKKPVQAQLSKRGKGSVRLNWEVKGIPVGNVNTQENAQYKAILNTEKKTVTVRAVLSYFDNQPDGWGKCTVTSK